VNSWNEIHKAATALSKRWKAAFDEKSQAQSFLKEFFAVFGVDAVTLTNGRFREKTYDSNHRLVAETFGGAGGSGGVGGSPAVTDLAHLARLFQRAKTVSRCSNRISTPVPFP
jgi:hypothetical protein